MSLYKQSQEKLTEMMAALVANHPDLIIRFSHTNPPKGSDEDSDMVVYLAPKAPSATDPQINEPGWTGRFAATRTNMEGLESNAMVVGLMAVERGEKPKFEGAFQLMQMEDDAAEAVYNYLLYGIVPELPHVEQVEEQ